MRGMNIFWNTHTHTKKESQQNKAKSHFPVRLLENLYPTKLLLRRVDKSAIVYLQCTLINFVFALENRVMGI